MKDVEAVGLFQPIRGRLKLFLKMYNTKILLLMCTTLAYTTIVIYIMNYH